MHLLEEAFNAIIITRVMKQHKPGMYVKVKETIKKIQMHEENWLSLLGQGRERSCSQISVVWKSFLLAENKKEEYYDFRIAIN